MKGGLYRLPDVLDGAKAWYSALTYIDFVYGLFFLFPFGIMVLVGMFPDKQQSRPPMSFAQAVVSAIIVFAGLAAVGMLTWLLNRLRHRYFPRSTFALGQGETRYTYGDKVRWVVMIGFVVSLFSSMVAAFFLS